jgi:bacterioferritin
MDRSATLKHLQQALAMELTAAHQYQLHAAVLDDWGIDRLAKKMRQEMLEELGHADQFLKRILFLKGEPVVTLAKTPAIARSLRDLFAADAADENHAIDFYANSARVAGESGDVGSRLLFEQILIDEENHMAWLELQLDLIERITEPAYIAKHMSVSGDESPEGA